MKTAFYTKKHTQNLQKKIACVGVRERTEVILLRLF